ncbi:hypothetical protein EDD17DRAFT_1555921 [Pisolithus thermaeus]|nr:hypothetical protein EDD17DRAFT_1555921 [Pisolithus thermaeus]
MLTPGSFHSTFPTASTRKPAIKRRKLNSTSSVPRAEPDAAAGKAPAGSESYFDISILTTGSNSPFSRSSKPSCSACHRTLSAARPGGGFPMVCTRCLEPTCSICSRTCTSYTRPSSFPPTPALTRSPTPSASHGISPSNSCLASPKRTALSSSWSAVNCENIVATPSIKRKKAPCDLDHGDIDIKSCDHQPNNPLRDIIDDNTVVVPGCGRIICRTCCVESVANDGTLCADCYALV